MPNFLENSSTLTVIEKVGLLFFFFRFLCRKTIKIRLPSFKSNVETL